MLKAAEPSLTKVAVVTGGSRGLGRNTVLHLAERGVASIFTYNASQDEAKEVAEAAQKKGSKAIALHLDTGKVADFDGFVENVRSVLADLKLNKLDYLINNAGIWYTDPYEKTTEAELDNLYNVNFKGVFFLTQKLLPIIKDGGRIVNISSGLTRFWIPNKLPYASLKGAIDVFTHYLAKELGPRHITVNSVAPGAMETDFSGGMIRDNPAYNKQIADMTALGRVGLPDDIGPMIASLLSEDNRWINGQRIEVSGGMRL